MITNFISFHLLAITPNSINAVTTVIAEMVVIVIDSLVANEIIIVFKNTLISFFFTIPNTIVLLHHTNKVEVIIEPINSYYSNRYPRIIQ